MTARDLLGSVGLVTLLTAVPVPVSFAQEFGGAPTEVAGEQPPVLPVADPVVAAIQYADRAVGHVHCHVETDLKEAGAFPPTGRDLNFYRALCTFRERTRELRTASRHAGMGGITVHNVRRAAVAADHLERIVLQLHLPSEEDQLLQDAFDMVAYLRAQVR